MSNYIAVLKLLMKNYFFASLRKGGKSQSLGKKDSQKAVYIILAVSYAIIAYSVISLITLIDFSQVKILNEIITVFFAFSSFIVLFFGIAAMLSNLYFSKDTEFFFMLPVKPSVIYLAKFTIVYLTELVIAALILVPTLIAIGIAAKLSFFYFFIMIFGIILAPALPLMLASIIAIPLMYIVTFFKNKGAITSILLIALFGTFFGFYFYFIMRANSNATDYAGVIESSEQSIKAFATIFYPFLSLARLATLTEFGDMGKASIALSALIFFGSIILLTGITIIISNLIYKKSATSQLEGGKSTKTNKKGNFIGGSQLKALVKKEWIELIRTPAFAYQCLSTVVLTPVLVGVFAFSGLSNSFSPEAVGVEIGALPWFVLFGFLSMFGIGMNICASTAITREGKNFYFSKMLPIDYKTQIKAKIILSMAISMISSFLSLIILTIATSDFINLIFGLGFIVLYGLGFVCFSVYFDLRKPKLDWTVPNEAVKQNVRIMVPYFINIVIAIVFILVPVICFITIANTVLANVIVWITFYVFAAVVAVVFYKLLFGNIDRLYDDLTI